MYLEHLFLNLFQPRTEIMICFCIHSIQHKQQSVHMRIYKVLNQKGDQSFKLSCTE